MGPPSLLSICMMDIASYIENGDLKDYNFPEKISNRLLQHLPPPYKSPESMERFFKNSKITKLILRINLLKEISPELIRHHDLEHLELFYLGKDEFKVLKKIMKKTNEIDILTILEMVLSSRSREKLRSLSLHHCDVSSSRRLMGKIGRLLPNLTTLDLEYTKVSKLEFESMCVSFPNLTSLSTDTNHKSLEGISNLRNLEVLVMTHSYIDTSDAIQELFQLKKLKVLDISAMGIPGINIIGSYLECGENLSELRFLDVSFTNITEEQLVKLVESHPKLEKISLIGTTLEKREQFPNDSPRLLNIRSLESCIESFKHYTSRQHRLKSYNILDEMENILEHRYEVQTEETLKECLMAILPTEATLNWDVTQEKVVNCLFWLCIDTRHKVFNSNQIQLLINTFLNKCDAEWSREEDDDRVYIIQKTVWRLINQDGLFDICRDNINGICRKAARIIENSHVIEDEEAPARHCLQVLARCKDKMSNEVADELGHTEGFANQVRNLMETRDFTGIPEVYASFISVSSLFLRTDEEYWAPQVEELLRVGLRNLAKFEENSEIVLGTMLMMLTTVRDRTVDTEGLLFEEDVFPSLTKFVIAHDTPQHKATVSTLLMARYFRERKFSVQPRDAITKSLLNHLSIRDDILADVKDYIPNPGDTDRLAVYKWLVANGSRRSKGLAQWILGHFPEAEEPRAKRRRI